MLEAGQPFPAFSLPDQDGKTWTNADLAGEPTIVYFYPKDDTSGCTAEACEFRDLLPKFTGTRVIGVSPDSVKSHRKFVDKFALTFTLLADEGHTLADACGVWVEKSMYGKKYMGVERTTFLVGADGKVTKVWNKVKPQGHAEEVLAAI
ncbi:MAG: thioredoxin-dependent thiol peroxidase [Fimbriimonadaceae bacterium]|nr:thioredoxin-dependent thiol peroxidase [Fimbriimonadaceae bacterium]